MSQDWRSEVLKFWFGLEPRQWWNANSELDHRIRQNFLKLWTEKRQLPVDAFVNDSLSALAAVILFDQVPRNMFRGLAEQFATDHLALAVAKEAVEKKLDEQLRAIERNFLYMPFEHSEKLDDQNRAVLLQSETGEADFIAAAKKHRDVIAKFGRFPHRNAMLGRAPRADEILAGDVFPGD